MAAGRDEELFGIIDREVERENTTLQLIASENFASRAVMEATGSVLTNTSVRGSEWTTAFSTRFRHGPLAGRTTIRQL